MDFFCDPTVTQAHFYSVYIPRVPVARFNNTQGFYRLPPTPKSRDGYSQGMGTPQGMQGGYSPRYAHLPGADLRRTRGKSIIV